MKKMDLLNKEELFSALVTELKKKKIRLYGDISVFKDSLYDSFLDFSDEEDELEQPELLAEFFEIVIAELTEKEVPEHLGDYRMRPRAATSGGISFKD